MGIIRILQDMLLATTTTDQIFIFNIFYSKRTIIRDLIKEEGKSYKAIKTPVLLQINMLMMMELRIK